ncbi:MAG: FAD:protein FMN transferase [Bacteroidales bacterium]|nr:FAD:protein FMN transferase [Bacteroidales bacterium]
MSRSIFLIGLTALLCCSCHWSDRPVRLSGEAQGTTYSIIYYDRQQRNLQPQIDSLLTAFDLSASLWVDSSLLRRINNGDCDQLDTTLDILLRHSIDMNRYTGGAFDCTVGKLVRCYGFGFDKRGDLDEHTLDSLRQYVGTDKISLDSSSRRITKHPGVEIDFNAIAQGYSVDLIADLLERKGIHDYLVDVGGEVIARGHKPDGRLWTVGIERPAANKYSAPEVETSIELQDLSVVTSGSYRKYYEKGGVKYSHTIDPTTGRPVQHSLLSVSVVDSYAWRADALATAFMVMGLEKSLRFIDDHPDDPQVQSVFFIYDDNGELRTFATHAFEKLIKQPPANEK